VTALYIPSKANDPFFEAGRWDDWAEEFTKAREVLLAAGVLVTNVV
jgi:hypothetical protein